MKITNLDTQSFIKVGNSTSGRYSTAIPSDVAVFVGQNGSGKSILLEQVAHSVQGGVSPKLQHIRNTMRSFQNQFVPLSIRTTFDHGHHSVTFDQNNSFNQTNNLGQSSGICIFVPASRDFSETNDRRIQDIDFPYGQKLFIFDQNQETNFEKILVSLSNKEIQAAHHGLGATREAATLARIRSAFSILFPNITLVGAFGYQFLARKDNISYPISFSSHGEKQALILLTMLAKEPNLDDSMIIIDEPEIGLSRAIRENLISAIRSLGNNLQLLVSTHSKEIIESVDPHNILTLD